MTAASVDGFGENAIANYGAMQILQLWFGSAVTPFGVHEPLHGHLPTRVFTVDSVQPEGHAVITTSVHFGMSVSAGGLQILHAVAPTQFAVPGPAPAFVYFVDTVHPVGQALMNTSESLGNAVLRGAEHSDAGTEYTGSIRDTAPMAPGPPEIAFAFEADHHLGHVAITTSTVQE